MSAIEKLMRIQTELSVPKTHFNSFGNFAYRNCEDILEAVKPLLKELKAVVLLSDEIKYIGERYYVSATATYVDLEDNSSKSVTALAREDQSKKGMDGSQLTGASSSYARKYALNGLFGIDDNKDSDKTNNKPSEEKNPLDDFEKCEKCKNPIFDFNDVNGVLHKPEEVIRTSKKEFGQQLCYGCYVLKKKNGEKHAGKSECNRSKPL